MADKLEPKRLYNAVVLVTSDTCYINNDADESGDYIKQKLKQLSFIDENVKKFIVPDEKDVITNLIKSILEQNVDLIITCGGTGLCPRDVTPEATSSIYTKPCPGISTALMVDGLKHTPYAALSRLTAGISNQTLIINMPGKLMACRECFGSLEIILKHALEQIKFDPESIKRTHQEQDSFPSVDSTSGLTQPIKIDPLTNHAIELDGSEKGNKASIRSSYRIISYMDAISILESHANISLFKEESVQLTGNNEMTKALGGILAKDLTSRRIIPNRSVSTMDGYVLNIGQSMMNKIKSIGKINATLVDNMDKFMELQEIPEHKNLFFCYKVNTGGPLPEKNYAVVPYEDSGLPTNRGTIPIHRIQLGCYIRTKGSDLNTNFSLKRGCELGPVQLATLLSMGHHRLSRLVKPVIGIMSTGDEIVSSFDDSVAENSDVVIDVNNPLLNLLLSKHGHECINFGITRDNPDEVLFNIRDSLVKCDILIVTGGASMGTRDFVKSIIVNKLGGTIQFGRIDMKPGKPAAFATIDGYRAKQIFILPGNPVSAYITTSVLVLPFIRYSMLNYLGLDIPKGFSIIGTLITVVIGSIFDLSDDGIDSSNGLSYQFDGRLEFVRAKFLESSASIVGSETIDGNKTVTSQILVGVSAKQQSSRLMSLIDFDCLILIHPEMKRLRFQLGQTYQAVQLKC